MTASLRLGRSPVVPTGSRPGEGGFLPEALVPMLCVGTPCRDALRPMPRCSIYPLDAGGEPFGKHRFFDSALRAPLRKTAWLEEMRSPNDGEPREPLDGERQ